MNSAKNKTPIGKIGEKLSTLRTYKRLLPFLLLPLLSNVLMVSRVEAHGAWLGNCVVDFSQSTKDAYQIIDSDNDGVADALGSPIGDGDFIEYQASCPVIVDGTDSGPGGWVTFYVPEGSRIANAWITDS
ncbi:MAG: hypothetical protein HOJ61_12355, partial [Gammaproteobacteria bacterium]|nr:hypothetical protein [Gammaproteobacteria bacterium]MBT6244913.1 hypothetical protein [Gammaproteobacteria bacterium]